MKRAAAVIACLAVALVVVGEPLADAVGPSITLSETPASPFEYISGSTVFYAPTGSNSGAFTVTAAALASSGIDSVDFPAVFGSDSATVSTTPFSHIYSWTSSASAGGTKTVTVTDGDSDSDTVDFTVTSDTTAPTGHSVALSGGPTYSTLSVPLLLDNGTDAGSGVDSASGAVERASAALSAGTCGTFGGYTAVTLSGGADTSVSTGNCYRYRYTVADNVGNRSAASPDSADAKVAAGTPTLVVAAPTEVSGGSDQFWIAASSTIWFRPAGSGSFSLNATASDPVSGIASVAFPDVSATSGWSSSTGGVDASSPYSSPVTYAWAAGAAAPGAQQVVATSGSGLTTSRTVTISADSTPPTGQTAALSGGPWYSKLSVPVTLGAGTDAGSGVDASRGAVERASAPLTNGACGAFGAYATVTLSGGADTGVSSGNCYRYEYKLADNVGNVSTASAASADAKVDATPPTAPSLTFAGLSNTAAVGNVVYFRPGGSGGFTLTAASSDSESGIVSRTFPAIAGFTVAGSGPSRTYSFTNAPSAASGPLAVTASNGAGLTSPGTSFTLVPDSKPPVVTVRCNGKPCFRTAYRKAVTVTLRASDGAGSGPGTIRYTTNGSAPTLARGVEYARPFSVRTLAQLKVRAYDRAGNASKPVAVTVRSLADKLVFSAPARLNVASSSRVVRARVTVSAQAIVTAGMTGPGLKKPLRWHFVLSRGTSVVQLKLPSSVKPRGTYTLVWTVRSGPRQMKAVSHVRRVVKAPPTAKSKNR